MIQHFEVKMATRTAEQLLDRGVEAYFLKHGEGLTHQQIAERMGVERDTIGRYISLATKHY